MLKHCDRVAYLAVPLFLVLLLVLGISSPPPQLPAQPVARHKPVMVEIIREEPTPKPEVKPKPTIKPKPEPKPEPKPVKQAAPKPKPEPKPAPPTPKESEADDDEGTLPPLHADYKQRVGFRRYVEELRRAGADFFVTGAKPGTLLQIDFSANDLVEVEISRLSTRGYSPRTRVISDEPALDAVLKRAADDYNVPNPKVLMLVPARLESTLAHALKTGLNMNLSEIRSLKGEYFLNKGRLHLKITHVYSASGNKRVNLTLPVGS